MAAITMLSPSLWLQFVLPLSFSCLLDFLLKLELPQWSEQAEGRRVWDFSRQSTSSAVFIFQKTIEMLSRLCNTSCQQPPVSQLFQFSSLLLHHNKDIMDEFTKVVNTSKPTRAESSVRVLHSSSSYLWHELMNQPLHTTECWSSYNLWLSNKMLSLCVVSEVHLKH